jgi:SAM-dependent methyltransferase
MADLNVPNETTPPAELTEWHEPAEEHLKGGEYNFITMCEILKRNNVAFTDIERILEFGCSNCRNLRHFLKLPERPSLFGTDIQINKVFWAMENLPELNLTVNSVAPPLPFADGYFGFVYAGSVFTHLVDFHTSWIAELARITRPGGWAYLSFHDEICCRKHITSSATGTHPHINRLIYESNAMDKLINFDFDFLSFGAYYVGTAQAFVFMSKAYIEKTTAPFFELVKIIPDGHDNWQTVYLFRRK